MSDQPQIHDDDELSVEELEDAAGGLAADAEATNVNGCGGNCSCPSPQ